MAVSFKVSKVNPMPLPTPGKSVGAWCHSDPMLLIRPSRSSIAMPLPDLGFAHDHPNADHADVHRNKMAAS